MLTKKCKVNPIQSQCYQKPSDSLSCELQPTIPDNGTGGTNYKIINACWTVPKWVKKGSTKKSQKDYFCPVYGFSTEQAQNLCISV